MTTTNPILREPIFVGGTGRCGTTVVGRQLLNRHPLIGCTNPAEIWFLTDAGGLCDFIDAQDSTSAKLRLAANQVRQKKLTGLQAFDARMRGFWYQRPHWNGGIAGMHNSVTQEQLDSALARFKADSKTDRKAASRQLVADLIDPNIVARGKQRWVETTPRNARRSDSLYRLYPDMKLVNMIRDGRDVAASMVSRGWGPDELMTAMDLWFDRMNEAHEAMKKVPSSQTLTLQLEDLVSKDREASYARLFTFLNIAESNPTRHYFETKMNSDAGHVSRWLTAVPPEMHDQVQTKYDEMLRRLDDAGVTRPA